MSKHRAARRASRNVRWLGLVLAALALGCGGPSLSSNVAERGSSESMWTAAQLDKLEPALRTRVRRGEDERVAVRVFFLELPTDAELSAMLLNRMGEHAIGQVEPETLHRIAARGDVERIEAIRDVGYEEP